MTQVTASLKVKKMRGGAGKKNGVVPRDSHCIYHPVLPPSKNDPGYGLSEGEENAFSRKSMKEIFFERKCGEARVKKVEQCLETVTVFITLFCRHIKLTQVMAFLKEKKMWGGPGKKDGAVLRDSHCIYSPCFATK
jgi:hypothetical protein